MQLQFAFVCDAAEESGGKLHALGIGIDALVAPAVPVRHASITFVASVSYSRPEAGTKPVSFGCMDADGHDIVGPVEMSQEFPAPSAGTEASTRFSFNALNTEFPSYGDYVWYLTVGQQEMARVPLKVMERPGPPASTP